jgi:glutamyl-tRNA synthetase
LKGLGVQSDQAFWDAISGNLETVAEASNWWRIVEAEDPGAEPLNITVADAEDVDFTQAAIEVLPPEPWSAETWAEWTGALKEATGRKGRACSCRCAAP